MPDTALALSPDENRVLLISTSGDGRILKTLYTAPPDVGPGHLSFDRSPDGQVGYIGVSGIENCSNILRVNLTSGEAEYLDLRGEGPAVSPDGASLAYVALNDQCEGTAIVTRNFQDGSEMRWELGQAPGQESTGVYSLSWSLDLKRIAFFISYGEWGGELRVIETTKPGTLFEGRLYASQKKGENWYMPHFVEEGLSVGSSCCSEGQSDVADEEPRRLLLIDENGKSSVLMEFPTFILDLDIDDFGKHIIWIDADRVARRSRTDGSDMLEVGRPFRAIAW